MRWEVVVVDNSELERRAECRQVVQAAAIKDIRYMEAEPVGLMNARHKGAEAARGEALAFIDDDSFVAETWLSGLQEAFVSPRTMLVTGPVCPEYESPPPSWVAGLWLKSGRGRCLGYLSLCDYGTEDCELSPVAVFGCNYAIRASLFWKLKGTLPDYMPRKYRMFQGTGESALSAKVANAGHQAVYRPQCCIAHLVSNRKLTTQYFEDRAYVFGIEGSFNQARLASGLGPAQGVLLRSGAQPWWYRLLSGSPINKARRRLRAWLAQRHEPEAQASLRRALRTKFEEGYAAHRRKLQESRVLREFVLREHYLGENAAIPITAE